MDLSQQNSQKLPMIMWSNNYTVPAIDTRMVPVTVPNSKPADIVKGIAGIARIWKLLKNENILDM